MFDYDELSAIEFLQGEGLPYLLTGSRIICDPPVMDTDIDIVVWDRHGVNFEAYGFSLSDGVDKYEDSDFYTYRQGDVNLIVVDSGAMFKAWRVATESAKALNLKTKDERIKHFQGVLYGNW